MRNKGTKKKKLTKVTEFDNYHWREGSFAVDGEIYPAQAWATYYTCEKKKKYAHNRDSEEGKACYRDCESGINKVSPEHGRREICHQRPHNEHKCGKKSDHCWRQRHITVKKWVALDIGKTTDRVLQCERARKPWSSPFFKILFSESVLVTVRQGRS